MDLVQCASPQASATSWLDGDPGGSTSHVCRQGQQGCSAAEQEVILRHNCEATATAGERPWRGLVLCDIKGFWCHTCYRYFSKFEKHRLPPANKGYEFGKPEEIDVYEHCSKGNDNGRNITKEHITGTYMCERCRTCHLTPKSKGQLPNLETLRKRQFLQDRTDGIFFTCVKCRVNEDSEATHNTTHKRHVDNTILCYRCSKKSRGRA